MIIAILTVVGLCLGSFVNALVWRLREQETQGAKKKADKQYLKRLSIAKGRSMCPACHHALAGKDLIPLLSWLSLAGKCRYCRQPISLQYPLIELSTAGLFVVSYLWWPATLAGTQVILLGLWLMLLTGLIALLVYDVRWMLLPNRLIYPLTAVAAMYALLAIRVADQPVAATTGTMLAVLAGGGIFYVLFQVSKGTWIGGGDVKLGWLLGLIVGTPAKALLVIFIAAVGGSLVSLPLLLNGRLKRTSTIPFGPFLIGGAVIVVLLGSSILQWYQQLFLPVV